MSLLLIEIDRFRRATGMSASRFGTLAANDPRLVFDLRRGREAGAPMCRRVRAFIAERRP